MNTVPDPEESLTLEILDTVQRNEQLSQRHLSRQLGVALGLANSYLKRCVRKGWVKVQQAPANRYLYYLTPTGFAEKSRLTAEYLSTSLGFYREAGNSCARLLDQCVAQQVATPVAMRRLRSSRNRHATRDGEGNLRSSGSMTRRVTGSDSWVNRFGATCFWHEAHDVRMLTEIAVPRKRHAEISSTADDIPLLVPDVLRLEPVGI